MIYEWDPKKATENFQKHAVSFDEAASVFTDPFALTFNDPDHSINEKRFMTIGTSTKHRILFLSHADQDGDHVRIISARSTTKSESLCLSRVSKTRSLMNCVRSTTSRR